MDIEAKKLYEREALKHANMFSFDFKQCNIYLHCDQLSRSVLCFCLFIYQQTVSCRLVSNVYHIIASTFFFFFLLTASASEMIHGRSHLWSGAFWTLGLAPDWLCCSITRQHVQKQLANICCGPVMSAWSRNVEQLNGPQLM